MSEERAYDDDLAYIHDVGYGQFALQSGPELLQILNHRGIHRGRVVDLGCGSGLWAAQLVAAGYDVIGFDISPAMLKIARRRVPGARFHAKSFVDAKIPQCDAVTSLGECLCYLFDKRNKAAELARLFRRVYASLVAGGLFIFDVAEPGRGRLQNQGFRLADDWCCLSTTQEDDATQVLTRHITSYRRTGKLFRRHDEVHRLQLYRSSDIAASLRKTGFRVNVVRSYGEYPLPKGLVGFVAKRPVK